jgi:hypothetical protein
MLVFDMLFGPLCWHLIWYYDVMLYGSGLLPLMQLCEINLLCDIKFYLYGLSAEMLPNFPKKSYVQNVNLLI